MTTSFSQPSNTSHGAWMKLSEAAQVLQVSEITLRRKIKTGKLQYELQDGKYYIFLDTQMMKPSPALSMLSPQTKQSVEPKISTLVNQAYEQQEQRRNDKIFNYTLPKMEKKHTHFAEGDYLLSLLETIAAKDKEIKSLKRIISDQETLIQFLEKDAKSS